MALLLPPHYATLLGLRSAPTQAGREVHDLADQFPAPCNLRHSPAKKMCLIQ
jgi:hypothetical protein